MTISKSGSHKRARKLRKTACELCGGTTTLQAHHKDSDPWNNNPKNVQTLCATCHGVLHAEQRWEGHTKTTACVHCGKTFTYKRARETACSLSCANKAAWARRPPRELQRT